MPPPTVLPPTPSSGTWPTPRISLKVDDLDHPGAILFFQHIDAHFAIRSAILASYNSLYTPDNVPRNVEHILLVLRSMPGGVAHTKGSPTHKEVHMSLEHIVTSKHRAKEEIVGVLVHEIVHCFQFNARGSCPGGFIEGLADWVRLNAGFAPPHWKKRRGNQWDAGYEATGYFLDWIEGKHGEGTVAGLNLALNDKEYDKVLFEKATGETVEQLWEEYCRSTALEVKNT